MVKTKTAIPVRRNGFYYMHELFPNQFKPSDIYVSVTNVLQIIAKPPLLYWGARIAARAALADRSLTEDQAVGALSQKRAESTERGQTIHRFIENHRVGRKPKLEALPKEWRGFARAFINFIETFEPKSFPIGKIVWSRKHEYAGALDDMQTFRKKNELWLIDYKSSSDIYPESGLQLTAYAEALSEIKDLVADHIAVVLLKEDGTFALEEMPRDMGAFLAAKRLWMWANRDKYGDRTGLVKTLTDEEIESLCMEGEKWTDEIFKKLAEKEEERKCQ